MMFNTILQYFKIIRFLFLLFTQICISQTPEVNQLLIDGEKVFLGNDFLSAKEIYKKAVSLDSINKNCWFNLAACELKLGETDNACEHFYQAYLLNDGEALKVIKENCPNFKSDSIMWLNDVEEKPKFIYKKEEYSLVINNSISPKYDSLLRRRFKSSNILSKYKGQIVIQFRVNSYNDLDLKVFRISGDPKEAEIIKKEISMILNNLVTYVSAKNKGVHVDLWEWWILTFNFLMESYK
ncbi:hypothetical protein GJU43_10735 [Flavobacterium sp. LC2016-23]|uniref:tetratricopeptide repeat protein n=1 Tax=Flavobacterium sp. LC2016-23 TaxID=2666330 RepID=UPI0012AF57E3|nr:hypothetical protein [Flavobacterium sp. LC2016-23]MRX39750.1 hypothetical protein [Flavobacterium sp. LC2016-23]